jgi:hypothetical protein
MQTASMTGNTTRYENESAPLLPTLATIVSIPSLDSRSWRGGTEEDVREGRRQ